MTFGKFGCKVDLNVNMKTPFSSKTRFSWWFKICFGYQKGVILLGFRSPIFKISKILGFNEVRSAQVTGYKNVDGNCTDCVHLYETLC